MAHVYGDGKVDDKDTDELNTLNKDISNSYVADKISKDQYTHLINEVSRAFQEIFKKRIGSVKEQDLETVNKIRNDMIDAYAHGKLSNEHYTNLTEEISSTYQKFSRRELNPSLTQIRKL